jgi:hypothetical protein
MQSSPVEQVYPIFPMFWDTLKQRLFDAPIIPVYPVRQLPHVLGVSVHGLRLRTSQSGAAVQLTTLMVDATLLIVWKAVLVSPVSRDFDKEEPK